MPLCHEECKKSFFQITYTLVKEITWAKCQAAEWQRKRPSWAETGTPALAQRLCKIHDVVGASRCNGLFEELCSRAEYIFCAHRELTVRIERVGKTEEPRDLRRKPLLTLKGKWSLNEQSGGVSSRLKPSAAHLRRKRRSPPQESRVPVGEKGNKYKKPQICRPSQTNPQRAIVGFERE